MSFDNLCKHLAETYPEQFASWILGQPVSSVRVLKTELGIEPIRADSVTFIQAQQQILHLEFQVKLDSTPPLPLRMLDYWVRLYRLYNAPITQVIILLRPPSEGTEIETAFQVGTTSHQYTVLRLWEQDPSPLLKDLALLPLAPLAAAVDPDALLRQVAEQLSRIEAPQRKELSACVELMAGLRFKKNLIRQLFREDLMRESVIYQDILEQGLQQGLQQGEKALVIRLLTRRLGELSESLRLQIEQLSQPQLEQLEDRFLDFTTTADLYDWLQNNA
jgi:predicted transposase/invertase (TIGR01784 family)